jgi:N-acyl-D-amino-acid deacylase
MPTYDVVITGGLIVDGSGAAPRPGSVGISGDRIVAVGDIPRDVRAAHNIAADGGIVCPGFIDIHTHSDISVISHPCCESKIYQGVTTEVVGNCGFSGFPVDREYRSEHVDLLRMIGCVDVSIDWLDLDGYGSAVDRAHPALNIAPLVGHGTLRIACGIGSDLSPPSTALGRMSDMLARCFEQGAFGFTTGLSYVPSCLANADEIALLVRLTAAHERLYATHARGQLGEVGAIKEAFSVAASEQARLQFSHLAINQPSMWGSANQILELFHTARSGGVDVAFDVYPYDASSSALMQHMPVWLQEGGTAAMRKRLSDSAARQQAIADLSHDWWGENPWMWSRFIISSAPFANELIGQSIQKLADDGHVSGETMALRLCEEFGNDIHVVLHYREERDVIEFMSDKLAVIGSDGLALPLYETFGRPHPRSFGSFPRVLGRFVRDLSALDLNDAILKMTSAPAGRLGLRDRGRLKPGYFADVLVIDPQTIADRATYVAPTALAEGLQTVIVNGQIAVWNGAQTAIRAGRVLRYSA